MFETTDTNVRSFYDLLNIIDNKAAGLLTFNALLLATISVWLGQVSLNFLHLFLDLAFLALLGSCFLLLPIIWLHWSQSTDAGELKKLRTRRTCLYRVSWWFAMTGVVIVILVSVVHTVGTGLKAFGGCKSGLCAEIYSPDIFGNLDQKG